MSNEEAHAARAWAHSALGLVKPDVRPKMLEEMRVPRFGESAIAPATAAAFAAVKREDFFPPGNLDRAMVYALSPIAIDTEEYGLLHQSCPTIYKMVLEELELRRGDSFLNVGSGTGYLSALASQMIGPEGLNVGVEVREGNVRFARAAFAKAVGEGSGCTLRLYNQNIFNCDTDNSFKFDKIYCGTAVDELQMMFLRKMLRERGVLIAPVQTAFIKLTLHPSGPRIDTIGAVMFRDIEKPRRPGVTFCIEPPVCVWSPKTHREMQMPARFRDTAFTMLLVEMRWRDRKDDSLWLPVECWLHILSMFNRQWFYEETPEPLPRSLAQNARTWADTVRLPAAMFRQLFPGLPAASLDYIAQRCTDLQRSLEAHPFYFNTDYEFGDDDDDDDDDEGGAAAAADSGDESDG